MARTSGHGNPHWAADETLLALELYQQTPDQIPGPSDRRVVELSRLLQRLPIHPTDGRQSTFRNPEGVAFKLQNLRSVATGKGLKNTAETDRVIWDRFGSKPDEVRLLAAQIRRSDGILPEVAIDDGDDDDDFEFCEGRIMTKLHRARERGRGLRRRVLKARCKMGPLTCDCCGTHGLTHGDKAEAAVFEVHHLVPLAELGQRVTRMNDVSVLCANCHRAIHRAIKDLGRWVLPTELAKLVAPGWGKRF